MLCSRRLHKSGASKFTGLVNEQARTPRSSIFAWSQPAQRTAIGKGGAIRVGVSTDAARLRKPNDRGDKRGAAQRGSREGLAGNQKHLYARLMEIFASYGPMSITRSGARGPGHRWILVVCRHSNSRPSLESPGGSEARRSFRRTRSVATRASSQRVGSRSGTNNYPREPRKNGSQASRLNSAAGTVAWLYASQG